MSILQLNPTIDVHTRLGDGTAYFIIDYNDYTNTVWVVRFKGGIIKHLYSEDVRIWGNPADGLGWDIEEFDTIKKIPKNARRNTDFLKNKK